MKILLVAYYWYPWNNSGAFRWLHLSRWIPITTVLTSKKANQSFRDDTMPTGRAKVIIRLFTLRAAIWALVMTPIIVSVGLLHKKIIVTITPEMLLLPALILQKLGKKVWLDVRDTIDRERQPLKILIPFYFALYKRIKRKVVVWEFFDSKALVIRHGYEILPEIKDLTVKLRPGQRFIPMRMHYQDYLNLLAMGYSVDYSKKPIGYCTSSVPTIVKYNIPVRGMDRLNRECFEFVPQPWKEIAYQWWQYLGLSGYNVEFLDIMPYMPVLPV